MAGGEHTLCLLVSLLSISVAAVPDTGAPAPVPLPVAPFVLPPFAGALPAVPPVAAAPFKHPAPAGSPALAPADPPKSLGDLESLRDSVASAASNLDLLSQKYPDLAPKPPKLQDGASFSPDALKMPDLKLSKTESDFLGGLRESLNLPPDNLLRNMESLTAEEKTSADLQKWLQSSAVMDEPKNYAAPPYEPPEEPLAPPTQYTQAQPPTKQYTQAQPPTKQYTQAQPPTTEYTQAPPPSTQYTPDPPPTTQYTDAPPPTTQYTQAPPPTMQYTHAPPQPTQYVPENEEKAAEPPYDQGEGEYKDGKVEEPKSFKDLAASKVQDAALDDKLGLELLGIVEQIQDMQKEVAEALKD